MVYPKDITRKGSGFQDKVLKSFLIALELDVPVAILEEIKIWAFGTNSKA